MTCVPHSRMKHDGRRHTCDGDLAFNRKTFNFSFYLVLLFYHVVLEELVAIGTGTKPSFSCLHIFFFNLDPRPFSLHLARNTSSNECLRPSNGWSQAPGTFSDELERLKNLYLYAHRTVQEPMQFFRLGHEYQQGKNISSLALWCSILEARLGVLRILTLILQLASKSSIISSFGRILRRYFDISHGNCFVSESNVRFASRCNDGLNDAGLMPAFNMSTRAYFNALKN